MVAQIVLQDRRFDTTSSKRRHSRLSVIQAASNAAVDLLIDIQMLFHLTIKHHHIRTLAAIIILDEVGIIVIMVVQLLATHIQLILIELLLSSHLVLLVEVLEAWLQHMVGVLVIVEVAPRLERSIMKKQYVIVIVGQVVGLIICVCQDVLIKLVVLVLDICDISLSLGLLLAEKLP